VKTMPKTVEELEIEKKALVAEYDGKILQISKELEDAQKHGVALQKQVEETEKQLERFVKAERDAKVDRFHAVTKDLSEELKKKIPLLQKKVEDVTNGEIDAFVAGFESKDHAVPQPPTGGRSKPPSAGAGQPKDNRSAAEKFLDR